jgi:hypothetical protein
MQGREIALVGYAVGIAISADAVRDVLHVRDAVWNCNLPRTHGRS